MPQLLRRSNDGYVPATTIADEEGAGLSPTIMPAAFASLTNAIGDAAHERDHGVPVRDASAIAFKQLALVVAIEARPQRHPGLPPREAAQDAGRLRVEIPSQSGSGIRSSSAKLALIQDEGAEAGHRAAASDDPVLQGLSEALLAVESMQEDHTALCADALRLAVLARLFALRSEEQSKSDEQRERPIQGLQKWRLKRVIDFIDNHFGRKIVLADLAAAAGLSRMHFAAQFRAATGCRPHEFILRHRIRRAKDLLRDCEMSIVEIALAVGFQSQAHFTTTFRRFTGDTPSRWRNAAAAGFERTGTLPYDIVLPRGDTLS
ncbi:helix-turn-helix transcriptional regulator [Bradyrhizobium sp. KB893862 SZCCT0404]|nr:helix-turn-helix transcriptional regulator [Bradyrhizobium sp. KB893862 SZCCT0404]